MKHRVSALLLILLLCVVLCVPAFGVTIKPVGDPWDDPKLQEQDGEVYTTAGSGGYVVVWETPECSVDGRYVILDNGTKLTVDYRITYLDDIPWGFVKIPPTKPEEASVFEGWVLMSELLDENGVPAYVAPDPVPLHPMIQNPKPISTPEPTPEPTPQISQPQRPQQAITINNTYNAAIVYTSAGIAVIAVVIVVFVLLKHKAVNKKGE